MLCTEWGKGAWELSVPWDPQSSPSDATVVCIMPSALLVGGRDSITAHWVSFLLSFLDGTTDISQGSKLMGWKEGNHPPRIFLLFILNTWSRYRTSRKCIGTIRCHYIFPPQVKTHHYFPLPGKKEEIPLFIHRQDNTRPPQLPPACSNHPCLSPGFQPKFHEHIAYFKCSTLCSKSIISK